MRNALIVLSALCVGSSMVGCSKKTPAQAPAKPIIPIVQPTAGPVIENPGLAAWTVKLQSKCAEGTDETRCRAAYGFSVSSDGTYVVGPGPGEKLKTGELTAEELKGLTETLSATLEAPNLESEVQETTDEVSESEDVVTLTRGTGVAGSAGTLVKFSGNVLYHQLKSMEVAKSVVEKMRTLADHYYPAVFPTCEDNVSTLDALYANVQTCTKDTDCTYVDESAEAVTGLNEVLLSCYNEQPLYVGNSELVKKEKANLLSALEKVRSTCEGGSRRANCTTNYARTAVTGAATCEQNVCKVKLAQ